MDQKRCVAAQEESARQRPLRRLAVLLGPALGAGQTGDVHDVVRDLDETLTGQDWPVADSANGVFSTQHVLPEPCDYSTPDLGPMSASNESGNGIGGGPTGNDAGSPPDSP